MTETTWTLVATSDGVAIKHPEDLPYHELSFAIESIAELVERISVMKPVDTSTKDSLITQLGVLLRIQSEYFTVFRIIPTKS